MNAERAGKVLLWAVFAYHVGYGILLLFSGEWSIRFAEAVMGWHIQGSPELGILGEILGCYAIAFGLMAAIAARDPVRYRPLVSVAVVLVALRLIQRVLFADKVMKVFEVEPTRFWLDSAFVLVFGVLLLLLWLKLRREPVAI